MNILLLGSGGREHALAWKIAASPLTTKFWCAPGNAGIAQEAECVALDIADHAAVVAFCKANNVDFVVVGPEAPLVAGLVDRLSAAGIKTFGPTAAAAALEGSKGFMKDLCARHAIPTAAYARFTEPAEAKDYIRRHGRSRAGNLFQLTLTDQSGRFRTIAVLCKFTSDRGSRAGRQAAQFVK